MPNDNSVFRVKSAEVILSENRDGGSDALKRTLGPFSLIALGIGAVIGAGIFTLTGIAAATKAGPALVFSFILAGLGCALAGLCYSEFSTMIPVAGSAYTYAYATMGELIAWIIGWDLVLEYAVGAATVSISWSKTLVTLLYSFGVHLPPQLLASPFEPVTLGNGEQVHGLFNLPAVLIIVAVTALLISGTRESAAINSIIVFLKVAVLLVFIGVGWFYMNPSNHTPFIPENTGTFGTFGWSGILSGAGLIFFAYIGFDAVSTAAQETRNPKRDMPIGIIGSLVICTALFIAYSFVLTGIVNYRDLNVAAPLALALERIPYPVLATAMNLAVLAGLTSVILVMLLGQSRVFYAMSKDGLLPKVFSAVHPKLRTPWRCNLLLMAFVSCFSAFAPIALVGAMTSIGTLFAFCVVCVGIVVMRRTRPDIERPFTTPWSPFLPLAGAVCNLILMLGLGWGNWMRLIVWLMVGFAIYFGYSRSHSHVKARPAS